MHQHVYVLPRAPLGEQVHLSLLTGIVKRPWIVRPMLLHAMLPSDLILLPSVLLYNTCVVESKLYLSSFYGCKPPGQKAAPAVQQQGVLGQPQG